MYQRSPFSVVPGAVLLYVSDRTTNVLAAPRLGDVAAEARTGLATLGIGRASSPTDINNFFVNNTMFLDFFNYSIVFYKLFQQYHKHNEIDTVVRRIMCDRLRFLVEFTKLTIGASPKSKQCDNKYN